MEFDEVVVKESPGLCRCCLSEGCYKDLGSEYNWMGDTEIYADMLLECFDIGISQHAEGPNGPNRLICEVCITRLRDSCNFKKQVLDSEKRFIDMLHRGEFRSKAAAELPVMKQEAEALEVEYLDDLDFGDDGDDQPKTDTEPEQAQAEDITVTTLPMKRGRGRPRKSAPEKPERRAKVAKVEQPKASKAPAKGYEGEDEWTALQRMRVNMKLLLENTNVMPFRWVRNNYKCFFCMNTRFREIADLRAHYTTEHKRLLLPRILKKVITRLRQIRLDVSDLSCKLCSKIFDDVHKLIDHIVEEHKQKYHSGLERHFFQVKLSEDGLKCFDCGEEFNFFQHLVAHSVNKHEKGIFLCSSCGKGFEFYNKLREHTDRHTEPIKCAYCEKTFANSANKKAHEASKHNVGGYPCKECGSSFTSFHKMRLHALSEHNKGNRYPCKMCSLTFPYMLKLKRHIRSVHLGEKYKCPICDAQVVNLHDHMVCHSDVKPHVCEVCQKAFARKYNKDAHMKTHQKSARLST